MRSKQTGVHAVLQAGGRGARLSPITDRLPKPLLRVGNVPMVERLVRQLCASGISTITVITGWLGASVETHLRGLADLPSDLDLDFFREDRPLGNVGALAELPPRGELILTAFADLVTDLDFSRLLTLHRQRGADVTLASHWETHRLRLGEMLVQGDRVVGYQEKPEKRFLICSGIAVWTRPVLGLLEPGRQTGIADLVGAAILRGFHVTHWLHEAFWMDVNTPAELERIETALSQRDQGR